MGRDISLDGAEISIIKAIGINGGDVDGTTLVERCAALEVPEIIDTLKGLISVGYVDADEQSFYDEEDLAKVHFRVNSGYAKDLKEAVDPDDQPQRSKRVRRE